MTYKNLEPDSGPLLQDFWAIVKTSNGIRAINRNDEETNGDWARGS